MSLRCPAQDRCSVSGVLFKVIETPLPLAAVPLVHEGPEGPIVGVPREPSRRAFFQAPSNALIHKQNRVRAEARSSQRQRAAREARDAEFLQMSQKRAARWEAEDAARDRVKVAERERDLMEQASFIENSIDQARAVRDAAGRAEFMASLDKEAYLEGQATRLAQANANVEEGYISAYRRQNPTLLDKKGEVILWQKHLRR